MMKIFKLPVIMAFSLLAIACTGDEDEELVEVVLGESGLVETFDPDDKYEFYLTGSGNFITLKGDIAEISISGEGNQVIIEEDSYIEKLTITGSNNAVEQADDLSVTIETITISSDSNVIIISEYIELVDAGDGNQVALTLSDDISTL